MIMRHGVIPFVAGALIFLWACGAASAQPATGAPPLPEEAAISRIAFGSCAFQWAEQPILRAVVDAKPNLYLSLGDAIYGDFDGKRTFDVTPDSLRAEWRRLADHPDWRHLVSHVPVLGTWDNHDYGHHSAGAEFLLKAESKEIFLDFFGEPEGSARRQRAGLYDAKVFGPSARRVQVILLDTRSFKSPPLLAERPEGARGSLGKYAPNWDSEATLLGPEQWTWLEEQLRRPAELRIIASSGQVVADEKGMDEWGNYPLERRRLFDLIAETGAKGVVLLSGNVHFAEVSATDEGPYPLVDFTSSGLTHTNKEYPKAPNRHRVAGPFVDSNFGLVTVDWRAEAGPVITLSAIGTDGKRAFEYGVPLSSLAPK
ncbi:MAG: alkaline phosphatase family protein [Rhodospirillales bacterium]|nr:MAG: alkaline phosphatase family protein [Rhodospirillales bacterium]